MATKVVAGNAKTPGNGGLLVIPPIDICRATIHIVGDSLLCTQPFSEKARRAILDAQTKGLKAKKEPKNPEADYEASKYLNEAGQCCVRAIAFKAAAVDAASQFDKSVTKVFLRGAFHIPAELIPIIGEPRMRQDMVRVGMGTADIRFRAEFWPWEAKVPVRYNSTSISLATLVELFRMGGFASGIGEYRPQRDGAWGMYSIKEVIDEGLEG